MRCVDVNVLVYAHRPESPNHQAYREWLEAARRGPEPLALIPVVLSGFLRVVTHPRIFKEPTPLDVGVGYLDALRQSPAAVGVMGNTVPDLFLAAIAIEQGAGWVSADRRFAGVPGLRWVDPLGS
jgi:predicted nucleic acid-binding protein